MNNVIKTKIFTKKNLKEAAELIRQGKTVAFPTETVYGLGADATNAEALKKIFKAKRRPQDNPLIVHVSSIEQAEKIGKITEKSRKLMKKFWPGPLTIIFKKKKDVPKEVTAGLLTVAIRMPNHSVALELIKLSKTPIAAPSANISGRPSSTSFKHVFKDLNNRVSGIVKHQESKIGIESTVIDLTVNPPVLLRPGGVSFEKLKKILPNIILHDFKKTTNISPGMKYKHYSPKAKIILFEKTAEKKLTDYKIKLEKKGYKVCILKINNNYNCSSKLFGEFRNYDEQKTDYILINAVSETGIGLAIMNRARKAAHKIIK